MRYGIADMVFKKSFLSYCLWILYTVATAAGLFAFAAYICLKMGYPTWTGFAACLCLLMAEALACAFFHVMNKRGRRKRHNNKNNIANNNTNENTVKIRRSAAEGLTVVVIFGILLIMRIMSITYASAQSPFFDEAIVRSGIKIEPSFQTSVYMYLRTLNFICFVFGNKITVGYIFQIVLQLWAFIMLYFAVRKISGVIPAVCAVLFPGIIYNFNDAATVLSPRTMLFFIFALGLLLVSVCFDRDRGKPAFWFIAGIYIGFCSGIEIAVCALLFVVIGGNFVRNNERKISEAFFNAFMLIIGMAGGFIGYTFFNAAVNGVGFEIALEEWVKLIYPGQINAVQLGYIPFLGYDNVLVLFALCFGIFTFFLNGSSYGQGLWTSPAVFLIGLAMLESSPEECAAVGILYTVLAILAGIAIKNVFPVSETVSSESFVKEADEIEDIAEEYTGALIEEKEKNNMFSGKGKDKKAGEVELDNIQNAVCTGTPGKIVTVNVDGENRQIKLLDNPMTLPKKREHKAMDYDIEVSDDDDYDIK